MRALAVLMLLACSCSSDKALVRKATATATYYQEAYMWRCIEKAGPDTCRPCQLAINRAAREIPLANSVQKIGPMPPKEVAELKELLQRLEECP